MQITRLKLHNYKRFQEKEISFKSGINILLGHNEAGKSTLAQALLDALYLNPSSSSVLVKSKKNWQNNGLSSISLSLDAKSSSWQLNKDFTAKKAELISVKTGKVIEGAADVTRELEKILPFKTPQMYEGTAFITHDDIAKLHSNSDDFVTAIQNLAVDGVAKVKVKTILEGLEKQKRDLLRGITTKAANDGKIKTLRIKISALELEISELKVNITNNSKLQLEQQELSNSLNKLIPEIETLKILLENHDSSYKINQSLEKAKQVFSRIQDQIDKLERLKTTCENAEAELSEYAVFLEDRTSSDLDSILLAESQNKITTIPQKASKPLPFIILASIGLLGLLLGLAISNNPLSIISGLMLLVGVGLTLKAGQVKTIIKDTSGLSQLEISNILAEYQCSSVSELRTSIKKAQNLETKVQSQQESLRTLTSGHSMKELLEQRDEVLSEKLSLEKQISTQANNYTQLEISRFRRDLETQEKQLYSAQKRQIEIQAILRQSNVNMEDLTVLEEKFEILKKQEVRLNEEVAVIELIIEGISYAISDVASASAELIESEINKYLPILTEGRYLQTKLNSKLELEVFSSEKNDWVDPRSELSRGTLDQVYFLARLAFIKLLSKEEAVPIILDDPFLTFDEDRLQLAMQILTEFSKDYQIIFFTFNPAYRNFSNQVQLV